MDLEEALQKIATLTAEKADVLKNFENYREVTKEEKRELTKQLETAKAEAETSVNATKTDLETLQKSILEKELARKTAYMDKRVSELTKWDEKRKAELLAEYSLLNLPDDTEEAIGARLEKANRIFGAPAATMVWDVAWAWSWATGGDGGSWEGLSANTKAMLAASWVETK